MADNVDFDNALYRPIANGKEFNKLIPKPNGNKTEIGSGDTDFSIKKMKEMVQKYSSQMSSVASKIQTRSLTESIANVKDFIYNHFQYKADQEDQLLRSPSYAWHIDRYSGIDCKSYSILASCLLTEMGILHYIRKIKQPMFAPTEWTHVYVVVPVDQKTGDLQNGYYTVDGTLEEDYEPAFVDKIDLFMSLKHYSLNAPHTKKHQTLKGGVSLDDLFNAGSLLTNFNSIFSNFWQKLGCTTIFGLNNHMVNPRDFDRVNPKIANYFETLLSTINENSHSGNLIELENNINQYLGMSNIAKQCYYFKTADGFDRCSRAGLYAFEQTCFIYQYIGQALKIWMNANYNVKIDTTATTYTKASLPLSIFEYSDCDSNLTAVVSDMTLTEKGTEIKAFEITSYLKNNLPPFYSGGEVLNVDKYPINATQFLNSLGKSIVSFDTANTQVNPSNNAGNPSNTGNNPSLNNDNVATPGTTTAGGGIGGLFLGLTALGLIIYGVKNIKDKPASKKNS